jgi:hypothetical protein
VILIIFAYTVLYLLEIPNKNLEEENDEWGFLGGVA